MNKLEALLGQLVIMPTPRTYRCPHGCRDTGYLPGEPKFMNGREYETAKRCTCLLEQIHRHSKSAVRPHPPESEDDNSASPRNFRRLIDSEEPPF